MRNIFLLISIVATSNLYAGAVGGGGTSGFTKEQQQMTLRVLEGASLISLETLGANNLFRLDMKNRLVIFDAEREVFEESAAMPFEEVAKFAIPMTDEAHSVLEGSGD